MNAHAFVSPLLLVAGALLTASPAIAVDFVFPRPVDGWVVERTLYTVAYVEIWQTDKDGKDATGMPLRTGWVGAPPGGDFTAIDGGQSIFVRDELRMFVPRDPKLPDVRQRITDRSAEFRPSPPEPRFAEDAPAPPLSGAANDLMIEAIVRDPATGRFILVDAFGTIHRKVGAYREVLVPDLFADTNGDGIIGTGDLLYSLVDLTIWLEHLPSVSLGDSFVIVDGQVAELPGMWFSTTPFIFDPETGFRSTGLFSSSPAAYSLGHGARRFTTAGAVTNAMHGFSATPEPTTWAFLVAGFGMVGIASRRRREVQAPQVGGPEAGLRAGGRRGRS